MNILFIDTSNNKEIKIGLRINGSGDTFIQKSDQWKAQVVLPMVTEILQKYKLTLQDIHEIQVNPGPGSFTGLRVGAAIANTLGTWLKIPINGKKVGEIVEPAYESL